MKETFLINLGAVTVNVHTQLRNALRNSKKEKGYEKPPFKTRKILKHMHTDKIIKIRRWQAVHIKVIHRRYKRLWNVYLPMQKFLE